MLLLACQVVASRLAVQGLTRSKAAMMSPSISVRVLCSRVSLGFLGLVCCYPGKHGLMRPARSATADN